MTYRPDQGYQQLEHPNPDCIAIQFWAPTEEALLVAGGRAIVDLVTDGADIIDDNERRVEIEGADKKQRMVRFLGAVLDASANGTFLLESAELHLADTKLVGTMLGEAGEPDDVAAKIARVTEADVELVEHEFGWWGRVVLEA